MRVRLNSIISLVVCFMFSGCSLQNSVTKKVEAATNENGESRFGVLLMAHGGASEWNEAVISIASNTDLLSPIEIAFGMADAGSIERAVRRLEDRGVTHVGVVRLFVSGKSWLDRTEMILGLKEGAPSKEEWVAGSDKRNQMAMPMGFWNIDSKLKFSLSKEGLANSLEMDIVLKDRVASLSKKPKKETVIVIAHGTGDDNENADWIRLITERTRLAQAELGINQIKVFSLREDWMEKRSESKRVIRDFIKTTQDDGNDVIVIPYRVQGFGPYRQVLQNLSFRSNGVGLLPHPNVGKWITNQANMLKSSLLGMPL